MPDDLGAGGLRFEREGPIGWCIIDRPQARNAFTPAMYVGIKRAVQLVNRDPDLAALIITGVGDVFAPGGDLGGRSDPGDAPNAPGFGNGETLPFLTIRDSRAPVIAAVNGICQAATEVLQTPPMTRMIVKRMLNDHYPSIDYPTMTWALEESDEPREGMRAFMEKRAPSWVPEGLGRI